jgi:hypothetical protein
MDRTVLLDSFGHTFTVRAMTRWVRSVSPLNSIPVGRPVYHPKGCPAPHNGAGGRDLIKSYSSTRLCTL